MNFYDGSGYYQTTGNNSDYDYSFSRGTYNLTFEQKTDYYSSNEHPRIFVETASVNRNCPAGLTVTKAKYITYFLPKLDVVCIFKTEPFKEHFLRHTGDYRYIPYAGYGAAGFVVDLASVTGQSFCKVVPLITN
jgi:hypothetical protein